MKTEKKQLDCYRRIDRTILLLIYIFLMTPILMWLWFWFKIYVAVPCIVAAIYGLVVFYKNLKTKTLEEYKKIFNVKIIALSLVIILGLNIISGAGGLMFQNWDYHSRNALLHDMINHKWPVKYDFETGSKEADFIGSERGLLSYYLAWFLPAAAVGKISKSYTVASLFLFFYLYFGVTAICYLIFRFFKKASLKILLILIAITGVDFLAYFFDRLLIRGNFEFPNMINYFDTPLQMFSFHGFFTHWFWIFHQAIPIWIVTMLFMNNKNIKLFGLYLSLAVAFAPLPAVGLFLIMVRELIIEIKKEGFLVALKKACCFENIIPVLSILPILFLYRQNSSTVGLMFSRTYIVPLREYLISYAVYLVFEVLIFLTILTKKNKNTVLFAIVLLTVLPLFYLGGGADFGNRTTIPIMILLFIETVNFYLDETVKKYRLWVVNLILLLSLPTNVTEINRSLVYTYKQDSIVYRFESDGYGSLADFEHNESKIFIKNFITKYEVGQSFFTRFILK